MGLKISGLKEEQYSLLNEFLYEAIFIPKGEKAPPRSIIETPELQVYVSEFGTKPDDRAFAAILDDKIVGVVWARIMDDYGHIDDETPSLAISIYEEYRGLGIGTAMMRKMLGVLKQSGYKRVSLSVQRANDAVKLYQNLGFEIAGENGEELIMIKRLSA